MAVKSYMSSFPEIFDFLDNPNNLRSDSIFHHSDIFQEGNGDTRWELFGRTSSICIPLNVIMHF